MARSTCRRAEDERSATKGLSIAFVAVAFLVGCQQSPTSPTSSVPVISGVQIGGPREVPPGQTVRFTLIATLSDTTTRDVTSEATWTAGDGQVVSIVSPGDVTGRQTGTAMIEARFDGHRARKEVYVLPAGTFVLIGRLRERGNRDLSVAGARIEVTSGAGAGLVTTTSAEGVFSLYGVSGETILYVTKDGYARLTQTLSVTDHLTSMTIEVLFLGGHPDLSGTYTLTIAAASDCGVGVGQGNLPEEVRVRSYAAAVEQDDGFLWVTLSGPGFLTELESYFYGTVQTERAVFSLRNPDDGTPIAEWLSGSRVFSIEGSAIVAIGSGAGLGGMLSGELRLSETGSPWRRIAWCSSTSHQFVLSR